MDIDTFLLRTRAQLEHACSLIPVGLLREGALLALRAQGKLCAPEPVHPVWVLFIGLLAGSLAPNASLDQIAKIAVVQELLVTSVDVQDELIDGDESVVQATYGLRAVLIGTALMNAAFLTLMEIDLPAAQKVSLAQMMLEQALATCEAQHQDVVIDELYSVEQCLVLAKNKATPLVTCACLLASGFAQQDHFEALRDFATHWGPAQQLLNDFHEYRNVLGGIQEVVPNKKTIPIQMMREQARPAEIARTMMALITMYRKGASEALQRLRQQGVLLDPQLIELLSLP